MQEFWIRLVSLFIVVSSLWGYNMTIDKREQENKNTQHIAAETESTYSQGAYKDGTYTGSAEGFGGNVDVKVTIEAGKISSVDITAQRQRRKMAHIWRWQRISYRPSFRHSLRMWTR